MPGLFPIDREPLDDKQQRNDELEQRAGREEDETPPGIELRRASQRHGYADGQDGVADQAQLCQETERPPPRKRVTPAAGRPG
jgi:hypothetical protein